MSNLVCALCILGVAAAAPGGLLDSRDLQVTDSAVKEYIQPFEDLHLAETRHAGMNEKEFGVGDDEDGYFKSKSSKGNKGYAHQDSYHKKNGDKYGYEAHVVQGKKKGGDNNNGKGIHYHATESMKHYGEQSKPVRDHKSAGTDYSYSHYESDGDEDLGHYTDGGDSEHYTEGDDGENYSQGDAEHYSEGDLDHYTEGDHEDYSNAPENDSESYQGEYEGEKANSAYSVGPSRATSYYIRHY